MNIFTIEVDILSFCQEKPGNVSNDLGDHAPKKFSICMSSGVTTRRPYDWIPPKKKHPQHWPLKKQFFSMGWNNSQGRRVKFHPSYPAVILRPFFWGGPHESPILSNLGESFERLVTKKDHGEYQNTCFSQPDLKESSESHGIPQDPWDESGIFTLHENPYKINHEHV